MIYIDELTRSIVISHSNKGGFLIKPPLLL